MKIFKTRNDLLDALPKNLFVVELGVFRGEFASELHTRLQPKALKLVDIWKGEFGSGDKDGNNHTVVKNMESVYREIADKYQNIPEVEVIRDTTISFLLACEDNSLDMVYVDADHSFQSVLTDLQLSLFKIKNGGILAGHDYIKNTQIAAAVDHFCGYYRQEIIAVTQDGCPSFVIQVNK